MRFLLSVCAIIQNDHFWQSFTEPQIRVPNTVSFHTIAIFVIFLRRYVNKSICLGSVMFSKH